MALVDPNPAGRPLFPRLLKFACLAPKFFL